MSQYAETQEVSFCKCICFLLALVSCSRTVLIDASLQPPMFQFPLSQGCESKVALFYQFDVELSL